MPEEGLEVVASGKLTTFGAQSKYQLIVDQIMPAGEGALMALLEKRKKSLSRKACSMCQGKSLYPICRMLLAS